MVDDKSIKNMPIIMPIKNMPIIMPIKNMPIIMPIKNMPIKKKTKIFIFLLKFFLIYLMGDHFF